MSHFTVMVVGENVDEQLAPYHEFECTGVNDQYVLDLDITDAARAEYEAELERHEGDTPAPTFRAWVRENYGYDTLLLGQEPDLGPKETDRRHRHRYGYVVVDEQDEVVALIDRTNPNKTWDWYQIGGRWSGFLKLKEDGILPPHGDAPQHERLTVADQAWKDQVDWEKMRREAAEAAGQRWDEIHSVVRGRTWETWDTVLARFEAEHAGDTAITPTEGEHWSNQARQAYWSQEVLKDLKDSPHAGFFFNPDEFQCSREDYVERARLRAVTTYALLIDGEWLAQGRMGWFGMSNDKHSEEEWARFFNEKLESLPDDALLTIVDCHI